MLSRVGNDIVFTCDECGDILETETSNFDAARSCLKQHGWLSTKGEDDEKWQHVCKTCQVD